MVERQYVIPLRKEFRKAPSYKRAKKSVTAIKEFISKHMKVEDVKICKQLNHKIWERGGKNPPPRIKIHTKIEKTKESSYALVELEGFDFPKIVEKKEDKKLKKEEKVIEAEKVETLEEKQKEESKKALRHLSQKTHTKASIVAEKPKTIKNTGAVSSTGKSV
ncbi:60S ribosomal protein L31 [Candidatus Woesearchaeota archaeon]|nr:60S ribosomal protein L31 [Candidatus Woesearchaeota archaeon]